MCDHRLYYHSEHKAGQGTAMTVYCARCNAAWEAIMFIAPRKDGEEPTYLDHPAQSAQPAKPE